MTVVKLMTDAGKTEPNAPGALPREAEKPSITGFLVVLGIAVAVVAGMFLRFPKDMDNRFPLPGQEAPVFTGTFLTGETFDLAAERGRRVIILNFWASWCDPCIKEMPDLEQLYRLTRDKGVELIAINEDVRESIARDFTGRLNISMPVIWDKDSRIARRYGTFRYPETYVIDLEGNVAKKIFGPVDWASSEVVDFVVKLAEAGGRIEGSDDPLVGGSREQLSDRTRDVRSSPN
ncbi:MAG: TlpA family protein disulfide reductase [Deltaproteobacteria bacterium]|nr:TlpA family protein disulfide reductase [Deltaproteobacteria bacterium]